MQEFWTRLINIYKRAISPYLRSQCKFYPTCSEYALLSIKKYGTLKGGWKVVLRLMRCNPFIRGGADLP